MKSILSFMSKNIIPIRTHSVPPAPLHELRCAISFTPKIVVVIIRREFHIFMFS